MAQGHRGLQPTEWVGSCALAERKPSRWRKDPYVEAIENLDAIQV